jgi:excisionase family DNA binding protein
VTDHDQILHWTDAEIAKAFSDSKWAEKFPPVLTADQAAQLVSVPKATIYNWSSRGLLRGCARKVGRHLRIVRDKFIKRVFNEGITDGK